MTLALCVSITFVISGLCIASYARGIENDLADLQADYLEAIHTNRVLATALTQQTNTASDTRTVLDMVSSALGHSLNGDNDSAWAILGELGDTKGAR